jgi:type I restriction enzyme S subunit
MTPGAVVCLRTKNVQAELDWTDVLYVPESVLSNDRQLVRAGDIIVSSANSWNLVGKCSWVNTVERPTTFGGFVSTLRVVSEHAHARYVYWWFSSPRTQAILRSFGQKTTSISNLNVSRTLDLDVPLPPLPEQRRIASILDAVDVERQSRRTAHSALNVLGEALFEWFLESSGEHPRARIDEIATTRLGKMLDASRQTGLERKRYLRNANVQWFGFELEDLNEMDFSRADQVEFALAPGDVLVCEGGQPGRSAVWRGQLEDVYFQKALHRVRLNRAVMLPEVFVRTMKRLVTIGVLADSISSATISHLTGEKLRAVRIPIPPIDLQHAYVRQAREIEDLEDVHARHLAKLDELFASLQHRAFRGEL